MPGLVSPAGFDGNNAAIKIKTMQSLKDIRLVLEQEFPGCSPKEKKEGTIVAVVPSVNTTQLLELHWLIKDGRTDINLKRSGTGISILFTQKN